MRLAGQDPAATTAPGTTGRPRRRPSLRAAVQLVVVLLFVGFVAYAVAGRWQEVRDFAGRLSVPALGLSMLAVLAAIWCSFLCWRAVLADFGSRLPLGAAMRVFYVGQLGKYLPGKLWPMMTQARLGADYEVPRRASWAAAGVFMLLTLGTGLVVGALTLPLLGAQALHRYWWALAVLPVALVAMHPAVLNRGLALVLRLTRREPMPQPLSLHGIVVACGWCVPTWLLYGVSTWALARDLGPAGVGMLLRGTGAFAASWSIGFLLLVAPAGAGIREAAMIVLLSTSLPTAQATVIALVSRLLIVLGDVFWGVVALLGRPAGRQVRRRLAGSAARPGRP